MKKVFVTGGSGFVGQNLIPLLIDKGYTVYALARSQDAINKVEKSGAQSIKGDLNDLKAIAIGLENADTVFHLAASVDFFASEMELYDLHVNATENLLAASKNAGVTNFVYLGAASIIMNGKSIDNANETFVSDNLTDGYSKTKLVAEKLVLDADIKNFRTISIRPPLIWGKGDPNILPAIIKAIYKGRMQFIGGGTHKTVTCNVINVCEALILAEGHGIGGQAYFINDGEQVVFKDFIKRYVGTQGITVPDKAVSIGTARFMGACLEFIWRFFRLKGHPPLYKAMINTLGLHFTTDDTKAREELGYKTFVTIQQGLDIMNKY